MTLTHRERVLRAFRHQPVDRLPTQVNYTGRQAERLCAHYGVNRSQLPARLDNHLIRVDLDFTPRLSADRTLLYDWWGAGFDTREEGYFVADSPLADNPDIDSYPWPDPDEPGLLDEAARVVTADRASGSPHFIVPNFGWALFERAWSLRGMVNFFIDMASEPAYAEALLDRIVEVQIALAKRFIALGVDGGYFGDDYGGQDNMLISPRMWRTLFKPRLARMFAPFIEAGLPVLMHSDGRIADILPDLVEIGLMVYNPVQPEVTDHTALRRQYGTALAYYGGISTQSVLPFGTPRQVKEAAHAAVQALAPDGTGLLVAPSHRMMSDIPMANVDALLEAFAELSRGGV